ncbi:hypothetical protein [Nocardiopsis lambiniae]|uniref:Restriction endonuclease type IV Mrr domain-containing protein n=1 Tax=Nocardiopsis lambiniae TaxID=3075539 RepID=A0ABU2MDX2_9ACTN|nr:hypothetical protein [Nocardiopsis sp. DSM 44743]MDT0330878.1 hypothetical protein [Nocardiopsis sp. DSM 44743]
MAIAGEEMIYWYRLDPEKIERAVSMLIVRTHEGAQAIDGSGGDGGRDIVWQGPEGLVIFEVKSFSDSLTSSRKRQIKRSLRRASAHNPMRWVLILPLNQTPPSEKWFKSLKNEYPNILLEWRGKSWLDAQFAQFDDLRRLVEGDEYVLHERAREFEKEQAVLANGIDDVMDRNRNLVKRAQDISPCWGVGITANPDGTQEITLSEKYPGAADLDPVSIKPTFAFEIGDEEAESVRAQLEDVLNYGGDISVDERYLQSLDIEASEETKKLIGMDGKTGRFEISSIRDKEGFPLPAVLEVLDGTSQVQANLPVVFNERIGGSKGVKIVGSDASGVLAVTQTLDNPVDSRYRGSLNFSFGGIAEKIPYALRPIADFLSALSSDSTIELRLGSSPMSWGTLDGGQLEGLKETARVIIAIDEFQKIFSTQFRIPADLTHEDIRRIEMANDLMQHGSTDWIYDGIKMDIHPDRLESFLSKSENELGAILVRMEYQKFKIADKEFDLGPVQLHCSKMRIANWGELKDMSAGDGHPVARWVCMDGEKLRISRIANAENNGISI